jgi:Cu-Zn family superoxide dismutase
VLTSMRFTNLRSLLSQKPDAQAVIAGSSEYPDIRGIVNFYQTNDGVIVAASVIGLPSSADPCENYVFGFHVHEGGSCTGNAEDPFADTGMHYNPGDCEHPYHAGDLPPLFENNGLAMMAVLTNRFKVSEVVGRTVLVHSSPDDFTTQPAGNSGAKIACGVIER